MKVLLLTMLLSGLAYGETPPAELKTVSPKADRHPLDTFSPEERKKIVDEVRRSMEKRQSGEMIQKLPYGNYERLEMYQTPKVGAYLYMEKYKSALDNKRELLDQLLGSEFTKGNLFEEFTRGDAKARLMANGDFKKLAEEEKAALMALLKKIEALEESAKKTQRDKTNHLPGVLEDYEKIQKEMAKLAVTGEATEAFLKKYFGVAGKSAAHLAEARSVEELKAALKKADQFDDFRDLAQQVTNERFRIKALEAAMDATANGFYLQAKMEKLLGSKPFCDAALACKPGDEGGKAKPGPKLDGLFDRKSHDGKK